MLDNKEKRLEIYQAATDLVKDLYGSTDTGLLMETVQQKLGITDNRQSSSDFTLTVGDVILGMYKKESLPQLLKDRLSLTEVQIQTAMNELRPLLDKIPEEKSSSTIIPTQMTDGYNTPESTSLPDPKTQPIKAPAAVQPMRTFPQDMDISRAHTYGAFKGNDKPSPNAPEEPVVKSSQEDVFKI